MVRTISVALLFAVLGSSIWLVESRRLAPVVRDQVVAPVFTVAERDSIEALEQGQVVVKLGPVMLGTYPGGLAFASPEAALRYLEEQGLPVDHYAVFRLSGEYRLDTYQRGAQRYLNKSLQLVEVSDPGQVAGY